MLKKLTIITLLAIPFYSTNAMEKSIVAKPIKEIPNSQIDVEIINLTSKRVAIATNNPYPWYNIPGGNVGSSPIKSDKSHALNLTIKPIYEFEYECPKGIKSSLCNFFSIKSLDYPSGGFFNGLHFRIHSSLNIMLIQFLETHSRGWLVKNQQLTTIPAAPYNLKVKLILEDENLEKSRLKLLNTEPASLKDIALRALALKIIAENVPYTYDDDTKRDAYKRLPQEMYKKLELTIKRVTQERHVAAQKDFFID